MKCSRRTALNGNRYSILNSSGASSKNTIEGRLIIARPCGRCFALNCGMKIGYAHREGFRLKGFRSGYMASKLVNQRPCIGRDFKLRILARVQGPPREAFRDEEWKWIQRL